MTAWRLVGAFHQLYNAAKWTNSYYVPSKIKKTTIVFWVAPEGWYCRYMADWRVLCCLFAPVSKRQSCDLSPSFCSTGWIMWCGKVAGGGDWLLKHCSVDALPKTGNVETTCPAFRVLPLNEVKNAPCKTEWAGAELYRRNVAVWPQSVEIWSMFLMHSIHGNLLYGQSGRFRLFHSTFADAAAEGNWKWQIMTQQQFHHPGGGG